MSNPRGDATHSSPILSATLACTSTASRASSSIRRAASSSSAASSPDPSEEGGASKEGAASADFARRARYIPRRCSVAAWSASSRRCCCAESEAESGVPVGLSTRSRSLCKEQGETRETLGEQIRGGRQSSPKTTSNPTRVTVSPSPQLRALTQAVPSTARTFLNSSAKMWSFMASSPSSTSGSCSVASPSSSPSSPPPPPSTEPSFCSCANVAPPGLIARPAGGITGARLDDAGVGRPALLPAAVPGGDVAVLLLPREARGRPSSRSLISQACCPSDGLIEVPADCSLMTAPTCPLVRRDTGPAAAAPATDPTANRLGGEAAGRLKEEASEAAGDLAASASAASAAAAHGPRNGDVPLTKEVEEPEGAELAQVPGRRMPLLPLLPMLPWKSPTSVEKEGRGPGAMLGWWAAVSGKLRSLPSSSPISSSSLCSGLGGVRSDRSEGGSAAGSRAREGQLRLVCRGSWTQGGSCCCCCACC